MESEPVGARASSRPNGDGSNGGNVLRCSQAYEGRDPRGCFWRANHKNSTAVESLELYLYTAHHFSMSRTDLRAQAAVPVYRRSWLCPLPPPRQRLGPPQACRSGNLSSLAGTQAAQAILNAFQASRTLRCWPSSWPSTRRKEVPLSYRHNTATTDTMVWGWPSL